MIIVKDEERLVGACKYAGIHCDLSPNRRCFCIEASKAVMERLQYYGVIESRDERNAFNRKASGVYVVHRQYHGPMDELAVAEMPVMNEWLSKFHANADKLYSKEANSLCISIDSCGILVHYKIDWVSNSKSFDSTAEAFRFGESVAMKIIRNNQFLM